MKPGNGTTTSVDGLPGGDSTPLVTNELRWNPFVKKWVIIAPKRGSRPLDVKSVLDGRRPEPKAVDGEPGGKSGGKNDAGKSDNGAPVDAGTKARKCPFCVGAPEVPEPYDVVVLGNRFPALSLEYREPFTRIEGDSPYKVAPAIGQQNVVLYSPDHDARFSTLPDEHVEKLVRVWKQMYEEIGSNPDIKYVYEFENRGALIGVSLKHPHGQIYSFSWIPMYIAIELDSFKEYKETRGKCLLCDVIKEELSSGARIIKENENFVSVVPFFASWPHEVHVYPKKHVQSFSDFDAGLIRDFATILKDVNVRFDNLYPGHEMAFVMAIHQAPTDGGDYSHYHFHVEFYPPVRGSGIQKFAAGVELGTGAWINSSLPEDFAKKMRKIAP